MNARVKVIGVSFVLFLLAGAVEAQSLQVRLASQGVPPNQKAEQLRQDAQRNYTTQSTRRQAACLHEREAAARVEADPLKVDALVLAALLYSYSGDQARGVYVMEKAARGALNRGDVVRAAHAFVDAAFIALKALDRERALGLTRKADMLTLSPLLSALDKQGISRRIDPARGQLEAVGR